MVLIMHQMYIAFVGMSIVLPYQQLAINIIAQSKQLFACQSVQLTSRSQFVIDAFCIRTTTYQPMPKNKRNVSIFLK